MPNLNVILDGNNVIEACPDGLANSTPVSATEQQVNEIMCLYYDATSDGVTITGTVEGPTAIAMAAYRLANQ